METILMGLLAIEANQATIDIARLIHKAIDTKIDSFHGHSEYEEQFESSLKGLLEELSAAITTFEIEKRDATIRQNYDAEKNKETLHQKFLRAKSNYSHVL
jgi:hypothetical protein